MLFRPISRNDWPTIATIQQSCYVNGLLESIDVLKSKQRMAPDCCFILLSQQQAVGYCLAHPWTNVSPPELHQSLELPEVTDSLYLHDIAVLPSGRGLGLAQAVVAELAQMAQQRRYQSLSLVAVAGAASYWQRLGFEPCPTKKDLRVYGSSAVYMQRLITD
ncbi:hypothetical protein HR45_16635 [Shewanella mangrovi]|uniref:N-acetyltransferase domain-containing protein n=1 Tax=Shewanella mangrovi TaxID=1515746 RepID=A0A094JB41_9GAMM|nr:GNAT family N-acetyltransferase [Shewanella mangrovi]KFZ36442.1 hypothetical protein HR45_16635 [Shewanella mangrovi]